MKPPYDPARDRDVLLRLLSVTASLAGLCVVFLFALTSMLMAAAYIVYRVL